MSYFTDPMAALEEAEYTAKEEKRTMCVVEVEPNMIVVVAKESRCRYGRHNIRNVRSLRGEP
jgi:hypothetical protein